MKKVYLATDHAGFDAKNKIRAMLESDEFSSAFQVIDCGAFTLDPVDDYPDYVKLAARKVSDDPAGSCAIVFGGSGQGEAMVANKFKNIQAAVYYGGDTEIVKLSKQHNDANVLSIGARFVPLENVEEIVRLWLDTDYSMAPRHNRRLQKIRGIEKTKARLWNFFSNK
jgi:ribose 5-phosphate isomerase B